MQRQTIKEFLEHKPGIQAEEYRLYIFRDDETVFYVGQAENTQKRFLAHLGVDGRHEESKVGEFLRENAPDSGAWFFEQYTLEDCFPLVGKQLGVDEAEEALIHLYRPSFNSAANPTPALLPGRYKSSYRDREAENRKADELAARYGIE